VDRLVAQGKLGVKSGSGFYDYGGRSPEEIMKERDLKLIKLREFLKKLGELS
jgi:3-hydroxybutyryl-CoA dehydrogenase